MCMPSMLAPGNEAIHDNELFRKPAIAFSIVAMAADSDGIGIVMNNATAP